MIFEAPMHKNLVLEKFLHLHLHNIYNCVQRHRYIAKPRRCSIWDIYPTLSRATLLKVLVIYPQLHQIKITRAALL